jgi:hypothetical protein
MTSLRSILLWATIVAALAAACAGSAPSPSPWPPPSPSALPLPVTTPEQAVARVILTEPRLTGITPLNPDAIGQASWFTVEPASGVGAFVVTVRVGWGDCQSGCIDEHRWVYAVAPDGSVTVVSEAGGPVPGDAWPGASAAGRTGIRGTALAGPTCPVETIPPDPGCAARPVVGAVVVIRDASGTEVARATTGADGTYSVEIATGGYVVEPRPVEGLMGTPGPQSVTVNEGFTSTIDLAYDTGIR